MNTVQHHAVVIPIQKCQSKAEIAAHFIKGVIANQPNLLDFGFIGFIHIRHHIQQLRILRFNFL